MRRLANFRRFSFVILSLFLTANLWGQEPAPAALSGSGTSADPYQITSVADWNAFAAAVNGGYDYSGKYVQLEADVPSEEEIYAGTPAVTTMVGVWDASEENRKPFKGTFKGNGKTLIVSYTSDGNYTAPFRCTNGATITNNLTILGNINATNGYAAGVVGGNYGNTTKVNSNVTVGVNITGGGAHCGGIAIDATKLEMSSCLYNGQIIVGDYSAGFCATGNENTKFNKCIFDAASGSSITGDHTGNFIYGTYNTTYSYNYYYTNEAPTAYTTQGVCIYTSYSDIPDDDKFRMLTNLAGNDYYYVEGTCTISGIDSLYYQNNAQHGGITYDVMFNLPNDPAAVVDAECYTAEVLDGDNNPVNVSTIAAGTYTLRITGKEGYCSGRVTSESFIVQETIFDYGTGTENDPYQIRSKDDWNLLATAVNEGHSFAGEYLKLTANITVTISSSSSDKIVGLLNSSSNEFKWFSGTFDGDWHTLTFNVGTSSSAYNPGNGYSPNAPFRVIDGATIKNLTVDGTIYSTRKYNAGFVGFAYNAKTSKVNNIINCTSNIIFDGTFINNGGSGDRKWDCSAGGFVAENKQGNIYFNNCIFIGQLNQGNQSDANRGAGFVSYNNGAKMYFTNCTMAGTIGLLKAGTFYRASDARHEYATCYYVTRPADQDQEQFDATNCKQAYTDPSHAELTNKIYKHYNINSTDYYIPNAEISGLETTTYSAGETITIPAPTVTYYGRTLTRGTDYVIKKKYGEGEYATVVGDITLSDAGNYYIKIEATGSNYGGSKTTTMDVVAFSSWAIVQEYLADASKGDRIITLSSNIIPALETDHYLEVNGNVVLNLNGDTIDRHLTDSIVYGQVIRVSAGANLTINGPGTITGGYAWVGPTAGIPDKETTYYDKRDGGGIHNMGNLVLNNVDVEYNKIGKDVWQSQKPVARGGGIYSGAGSSLIINGGSVSSNIGRGGGGGVYCDGAAPFVMTDVNVHSNHSDSKGGGLRIKTKGVNVAYLTRCDISWANQVTADASQGGGVYMEAGELVMDNCTIQANNATMQGAGFFSKSGKTTAINCDISYNGTMYVNPLNHGGGVCLFDNKGSDHSIYIMDGGRIYWNQCNHDGGGVYVYEGAVFQVKGNVKITDNVQGELWVGGGDANNAYLSGSAVIEVIEPGLGEDAIINITPHDGGGVAVEFADGASSGNPAEDLSHFTLDGSDYNIIVDEDGNIESYEPYSWTESSTWNGTIATNLNGGIPSSSSEIKIHRAVKIPSGVIAEADSITCDAFCDIIIEDGAQLLNNSANVAVLAKKNVEEADDDDQTGWYLISSLVANPSIANNTNLITKSGVYDDPSYDLYRFNEAVELQWENYRASHADFTTLENGRGYLYRNENALTIDIGGTLNVGDITYNLSCSGSELTGFNIIGNPYSQNITLLNTTLVDDSGNQIVDGDSNPINLTGFYRLSKEDGSWLAVTSTSATIAPLEGFLVQVPVAAKKVKFSKTARGAKKLNDRNIMFTIANSQYEDVAYALFENGLGLNKIEHMNEDVQMVYINKDEEDFAIATLNPEVKQFDLNFEAKTTGYYTLKVEKTGEFGYMHLIDKLAEKDIDLLKESEYSFVGSAADNADRFIVRLGYSEDADNSVFAYQSGNDIVVSGEGELQIFDVMGRLVMQKHVNGVQTVEKPQTTGVFIMRLNDKTQKIVIR